MKEELREKTRRKVSRNAAQRVLKILKLGILAFIISLVPLAPAPHYGVRSSFANFPEEHAEFLSSGSYEALFGLGAVGTLSASGTSTATGWSEGLVVGTNVRVNALQAPFAAGLLGRSETTIAASPDGEDIVVGWNDAQGFCGVPFGAACTPQVPNGLSGFGFSTDGGLTWTDGGAPDPALGFSSGLGVPVFTRGDPWLAADEDGDTFFYANLAVHAVTGADLGVSVHRGEFDGDSLPGMTFGSSIRRMLQTTSTTRRRSPPTRTTPTTRLYR